MADEPVAISVIREVLNLIVTIGLYIFGYFKAFYTTIIPPEPKDVSEDIVLITGTGHGMGREMAIRFAKLDATVICVDVNPQTNNDTFQLIKETKGNVHKYECDVTDRAAVFKLAERVRSEVGDVTILINNAGIMPCNPFLKQTEQEIRKMFEINVIAYLWTLQAFLPTMIENNKGHLVAMSSMAGLMGIRNLVPYCGSKFGVRGIMQSLEIELHDDPRVHGINFTTVFPYIVDTGLCKKPRIKFSHMKVVSPGEAADTIVDAVRRNYREIAIPPYLLRLTKLMSITPHSSNLAVNDFLNTGVDPHD